ncbi:unnamed protein product [Mytilus coruscus]|uniref:Reverse transcriptase domain-containing protein n=1 Tax=Mytilus coruscus TaxID=42192 RepID=A0A6J8DZY7_MYTCO|nr:unnamed protein product [Mytilus coruscus]
MAEARPVITDVGGIPKFDAHGELNSMGPQWNRWKRAFELFAMGKGVVEPEQKKALFLHTAGFSVQDIYFTLEIAEPEAEETVYDVTVRALDAHFTPHVNSAVERSQFRAMTQTSSETVEQYTTRLRQKAVFCNFHNIDENIRDQVIDKCYFQRLRRKVLARINVTLVQLREIAQSLEASEQRAVSMEQKEQINKASQHKFDKHSKFKTQNQTDFKQRRCFACGHEGHIKTDTHCPARGKKCRKCKKEGHYEKCCKTKQTINFNSRRGHATVRNKETENNDEEPYVFTVNSETTDNIDFTIKVGGVIMPIIIDSGASVNVIDRSMREFLKKSKIKCESRLRSFITSVSVGDKNVDAEFFVVEEKGQALLGKTTAVSLGILKIQNPSESVNSVNDDRKAIIKQKFQKCFEGVGKLKNFQLKIPIDESVEPVIQPIRRVPFHLHEKLDKKLEELQGFDIIEKVEGLSTWVSPVVVIPKKNSEIRLCIYMRRANEAVVCERYPIPTVEEILQDLNQSRVYSKLDIKWAFHQIQLSQESRDITAFMTHQGLFRYKRLMFGISCAPEMYNKIIHQALGGLRGVNSIYDDIIVHGKSEEHNRNLEQLLCRLLEKGLTLNIDKCQFNMERIEFMGHILSEHGIGVSDSKVQAIKEARKPQTVTEVKSFMGLVNFTGRFIPNLAIVAEPLNRLKRKHQSFKWGPDQDDAFDKLKQCLASN